MSLGSISLPRFAALTSTRPQLPMASSVEGLYTEFTDANLMITSPRDVDQSCADEAKQILCEGIGRVLTNTCQIILEQLEAVPASYSNEDINSILRHGAFQINLDDFRAYWQGVGTCTAKKLDAIVEEAICRSDFPISVSRRNDLIRSIKFRVACGYCDIPGFELAEMRINSFATVQYRPASGAPQNG